VSSTFPLLRSVLPSSPLLPRRALALTVFASTYITRNKVEMMWEFSYNSTNSYPGMPLETKSKMIKKNISNNKKAKKKQLKK